MGRNMRDWAKSVIDSEERLAMPLMTYPGLGITGKGVLEMVRSGEVQYECLKALSDRYPMIAAATLVMALYVEAEAFGSEVMYSGTEIPSVSKRLVDSLGSLKKIRTPEVGEGKTREHLKAAELAVANIRDHPVIGGIIGPYSLAGRLYDMTEMMAAILIEPEGSHELLEICTGFLIKYAKAYKDTGCDGIIIAEPAAGLLGRDECHEFSSSYVRRIVENVQDENFIVILHNCGNTVNLVDSMVSTGSAGFHFGNAVDMLDILPKVPFDRLVFGNIDPAGIMKNGSPEAVRKTTLDLLLKTTSYRNYVVSTGCDIPPGTNLENITALFNTLSEYNKNRLKHIEIDFRNDILEREVLTWDQSLNVA